MGSAYGVGKTGETVGPIGLALIVFLLFLFNLIAESGVIQR